MRKTVSKSLFLLAFLSSQAFAVNALEQSTAKENTSKDWSVSLKNTITTNMYDFDSVNHYATNETRVDVNVKAGESTYGIYTILGKELQGERDQSLTDINFKFITKFMDIGENITLTHYPIIKLPTSEDSDKRANLQAQVTYILYTTIKGDIVGNENFSFEILPYVTKAFHEYTTTTTGTSNNEWLVSFNPSAEYAFSDNFALGLELGYTRAFTYKGNSKDSYAFGAYLSFDFLENSNATLGYDIGGAPLAANGRDTRVNIIDNREANLYLELATKF